MSAENGNIPDLSDIKDWTGRHITPNGPTEEADLFKATGGLYRQRVLAKEMNNPDIMNMVSSEDLNDHE